MGSAANQSSNDGTVGISSGVGSSIKSSLRNRGPFNSRSPAIASLSGASERSPLGTKRSASAGGLIATRYSAVGEARPSTSSAETTSPSRQALVRESEGGTTTLTKPPSA